MCNICPDHRSQGGSIVEMRENLYDSLIQSIQKKKKKQKDESYYLQSLTLSAFSSKRINLSLITLHSSLQESNSCLTYFQSSVKQI